MRIMTENTNRIIVNRGPGKKVIFQVKKSCKSKDPRIGAVVAHLNSRVETAIHDALQAFGLGAMDSDSVSFTVTITVREN